ncbi:hypothetical protein [Qipengyuania sp. SM2507]
MIGSIIAADYAETRDPRHLRSDRLLQGGFPGGFPFADNHSAAPDSAWPTRRGRATRPEARFPRTGDIVGPEQR